MKNGNKAFAVLWMVMCIVFAGCNNTIISDSNLNTFGGYLHIYVNNDISSEAYEGDMLTAVYTGQENIEINYSWQINGQNIGEYDDVVFATDAGYYTVSIRAENYRELRSDAVIVSKYEGLDINELKWNVLELDVDDVFTEIEYINGMYVISGYEFGNTSSTRYFYGYSNVLSNWNKIKHNGNTYYGKGNNRLLKLRFGDGRGVYWSDEGINWNLSEYPVNIGQVLGIYGNGVIVNGMVLSENNGESWINAPSNILKSHQGNTYANGVAFGNGYFRSFSNEGNIMYSINGKEWKEIENSYIQFENYIEFGNFNYSGIYCKGGIWYAQFRYGVLYSEDGLVWKHLENISNWINDNSDVGHFEFGIEYAGGLYIKYIQGSINNIINKIGVFYSIDGKYWQQYDGLKNIFDRITYLKYVNGSIFICGSIRDNNIDLVEIKTIYSTMK